MFHIRLRRWWWLTLPAAPVLAYGVLIAAAYIKPPLDIAALSTGHMPQPAAVIHIQNESRWPVTITGVAVKGVLPPDELGALTNQGGELPSVHSLIEPRSTIATGELKGWRVQPKQQALHDGLKLIWYQTVDTRWIDCPTVRYRYLGWPLEARGFCDEALRGPALAGSRPMGLGEWGAWQALEGGVRFRTQRHTRDRNDDLWIELAPEEGAPQVALTVNHFAEEPAGGHARFRLRVVTIDDLPGASVYYSVPLRWGEPTPELAIEVIPVSQARQGQ